MAVVDCSDVWIVWRLCACSACQPSGLRFVCKQYISWLWWRWLSVSYTDCCHWPGSSKGHRWSGSTGFYGGKVWLWMDEFRNIFWVFGKLLYPTAERDAPPREKASSIRTFDTKWCRLDCILNRRLLKSPTMHSSKLCNSSHSFVLFQGSCLPHLPA